MSRIQRGWTKKRRYELGHQSIRRISAADAQWHVKRGGMIVLQKGGGAEVWDKEGYCVGFLTAPSLRIMGGNSLPVAKG